MSWSYYGYRPYVPVAQRRANASRELAKLSKKTGSPASPVVIEGRKIASTFWGSAWCDNLESYSDYSNRLPRGRTYVRNGSVVDLQISQGKICARVAGSSLYKIEINIKPLPANRWKDIQTECAGKIDSLIELLQGRISSAAMQIVTRRGTGLFPAPPEIDMDCSCPDWADLCKHLAAVLYGVGARLDRQPELLFLLRGVNAAELISRASAAEAVRQTTLSGAPAMNDSELSDIFGIELAEPADPVAQETSPVKVETSPSVPAPVDTKAAKPRAKAAASKKPKRKKPAVRKLSAAALAKIRKGVQARAEQAKQKANPARTAAAATAKAALPVKKTPARRSLPSGPSPLGA